MDIPVDVLIALIVASPGLVALWLTRKKTSVDIDKAKAETESIHAQVADRWAEHVSELQTRVSEFEKKSDEDRKELIGLRIDITQVRRENEMYRRELVDRDQVIADLKDWAERLLCQLALHAPGVKPEQFYRKAIGDEIERRLRKANPIYDKE